MPRLGSKYGARKTQVDGIKFDSHAEAAYYQQLKLMKRVGQIKDFECQPRFRLLDAFKDYFGNTVKSINYTADFLIHHHDGSKEVIDVKGGDATKTQAYTLRKKLFLNRYRDHKFTEVTR
ncbi:DUF1064 domain-containing protein [Paenibacillus sp. RUD330]|uniref:DUF1064 domain-containing protein n=1 Tax=Paenibacillus sp. RUD330 TaxID=2023772 RepID=UPI000B9285EC|nr:DUF1064 domain-containing protein [Paenibacillus sp. RUD330]ASS66228.1 DUF1064 domain-containing protein [Paenibacillus sp. RUD330]